MAVSTLSLARAFLASVTLAACSSSPPHRESPLLATTAQVGTNATVWDLHNPTGFWAGTTSSGQVDYETPSGAVAPPVPGAAMYMPNGVRGFANGEIWVCFDPGIAHFANGMWTLLPWSTLPPTPALAYCDGLDGRSPTDVWISAEGHACHYDGMAWTCRDLGAQGFHLTLTMTRAWVTTTGTGGDSILSFDTSSATSATMTVSTGDLRSVGDLRPVPGTDQVWATHRGGDMGNTDAHLFSASALVRTAPAGSVVPVGADDEYLIAVSTNDQTTCSGGIAGMCGVNTLWAQTVVSHQVHGTSSELAHFDDPHGGNVPYDGFLLNGALYLYGGYRLP